MDATCVHSRAHGAALARLVRYDVNTDAFKGYAIFRDGVPFQAAYRLHGLSMRRGEDNLIAWLRTDAEPHMPGNIATFILCAFYKECLTEAETADRLRLTQTESMI